MKTFSETMLFQAQPRRMEAPQGAGGIYLARLAAGTIVEAETRNSVYRVQVGEGGELRVSGHPEYFPEPTAAISVGAVTLTGAVYDRYLAEGMRIEFLVGLRRIFTSRVTAVRVIPA